MLFWAANLRLDFTVSTIILRGVPNLGSPRSRKVCLLAPILLHSSSWAKVGGSCSLLGAILGGAGGGWPGNLLPRYPLSSGSRLLAWVSMIMLQPSLNPANVKFAVCTKHIPFYNQLEKLEAAKAALLVCLSLLSLTHLIGSFLVLLGQFLLTLPGLTYSYWAILSLTGPYWALLGITEPYWALLGLTGLYWAL